MNLGILIPLVVFSILIFCVFVYIVYYIIYNWLNYCYYNETSIINTFSLRRVEPVRRRVITPFYITRAIIEHERREEEKRMEEMKGGNTKIREHVVVINPGSDITIGTYIYDLSGNISSPC